MNVWIGDEYGRDRRRILVLGESWYGPVEPLEDYVPRWCRRELNDYMFARLFNVASGSNTSKAGYARRREWWDRIAFCNFVAGSVGATRADRPIVADFVGAAKGLGEILGRVAPRGVWVVGKEQAAYSLPVVRSFGAAVEVTRHTSSRGLTSADLAASWERLVRSVSA